MLCQNLNCRKQIDDDSTFCVNCGTIQNVEQLTAVNPKTKTNDGFSKMQNAFQQSQSIPKPITANQSQNYRFIEFRASDNIWNFTESEPPMQPEQRRPVLILAEETILLSETSKNLSSEDLLARVKSILTEKQVPVETYIAQARWLNDFYEIRPRIIAELKDHAYSGLKMVLGLDYMGNWATLQYQIGMQPDPIPKPPPSVMNPNQLPQLLLVGGIIGGMLGLFIILVGMNARDGAGAVFFGLLLLIGGGVAVFFGYNQMNEMNQTIDAQRKERERYEREQYQRALYKARMELFRTYKIDDAMLFREAMEIVFKQVVDDVIEQGGGKIVKEIRGGEESMFDIAPQGESLQGVVHSNKPLADKVKTVAVATAKHKIKKETGFDV